MNDARETLRESIGIDTPFLCSLATIAGGHVPRVRFVRAKLDPDFVLRIPTFAATGKAKQIREEPRVHITCGQTNPEIPGSYFQIDGMATVTCDPEERKLCWTSRLEKWFSGPDDPHYVVVKIKPSSIVTLPIGRAGEPSIWTTEAA